MDTKNLDDLLESGEPIMVGDIEFTSAGFLDYGNNDCWEVLTPKVRPANADGNFVESNYDVYFIEHQDYPHQLTARGQFLAQVPDQHLNTVIIQLGQVLAEYDKEGA
jgi:hypothetical protein